MLSMLVTTTAKVNRFSSVLAMLFSFRGPQLLRPSCFVLLRPRNLRLAADSLRHPHKSYRLGYGAVEELLDERAAESFDGLRLLRRKTKLVADAANLLGSDAFDAWVCVSSISSSAHISNHALSASPAPRSGA